MSKPTRRHWIAATLAVLVLAFLNSAPEDYQGEDSFAGKFGYGWPYSGVTLQGARIVEWHPAALALDGLAWLGVVCIFLLIANALRKRAILRSLMLISGCGALGYAYLITIQNEWTEQQELAPTIRLAGCDVYTNWRPPLLARAARYPRHPSFERVTMIYASPRARSLPIAQLAKLPHLWSLTIENAGLTDENLATIGPSRGLSRLDVRTSSVTDAGLETLTSLPRLRELILDDTRITDASAATLARLTSLRALSVAGRPLTDAWLERLGTLPRLTDLDVRRTSISARAIEAYRVSRPEVKVLHESLEAVSE